MSNIIPVVNKESGATNYLHMTEHRENQRLEEIFLSNSTFDIIGALIDMGFHSTDFEFAFKWIDIMMQHSYPNVRRNAQLALGYFCRFKEVVPDPNKVIDLLIKGILDNNQGCYEDVPEVARHIFSGRNQERKKFIRSIITLKVKAIFGETSCRSKLNKEITFREVLGRGVISYKWFLGRAHFESRYLKKEENKKGKIEAYDVHYLWDGPKKIISESFLRIIRSGTVEQALKQIFLISWYQKEFDLFVKGVKIALNRPEAVIRYYAIEAIWDYMVVFKKFYENEAFFYLLNDFIASQPEAPPEPLPEISEEIKKSIIDPWLWPSPSPLEYYEHQDLRQQAVDIIESMRRFIKKKTVGYDDEEE